MSATNIFWSFPPGVKQMIFDNLLQEEKKILCNKTTNIHNICKGYVDTSTLGDDVEKGDIQKVDYLLKNGADINGKYKKGEYTPLSIAIEKDDVDMVKFLLENGADISLKNEYGTKPWFYIKSPAVAEIFLNYGEDINQIDIESNKRDYTLLDFITFDIRNNEAEDALLVAKLIYLMQFLVKRGADINRVDNRGNTPLLNMLEDPRATKLVLILLLQLGANPNVKDELGYTPLDLSLGYGRSGDIDIQKVDLLLKYGADPNNKIGTSRPFYTLLQEGDELSNHTINNLLKSGIDIDFKKALEIALSNPKISPYIIETLLKSGVDIDFKKALLIALSNIEISANIVETLIKMGANAYLNERYRRDGYYNTRFVTPLEMSLRRADIVKLLLKYGADPNIKNKEGLTVLDEALKSGYTYSESMNILSQYGAKEGSDL